MAVDPNDAPDADQDDKDIETPEELTQEDIDLVNMSDEDFMAQEHKTGAKLPADLGTDNKQPEPEDADEDEKPDEGSNPKDTSNQDEDAQKSKDTSGDKFDDDQSKSSDKVDPKAEKPKEGEAKKEDEKPKADEPVVDYKAAYDKIMAPFKANGKQITLANPDEVISLMQMGANYTKKLQELKPTLKIAKMLENNGLMDESKVGFLIDLHKKNPEAIKKLVRDANIDPIDMDTSVEPAYQPGNHRVSDQQITFDQTLAEVVSTDHGKQALVQINKEWDRESKEAIYKDPAVLRIITEQKRTGIYDQIDSEVHRLRTLGQLGGISYLNAYYQIGQSMQQRGLLKTPQSTPATVAQQPAQEQAQVIETRSAAPSTAPKDQEAAARARAAGSVRTAPKEIKKDYNPLSMSDEEFEKSLALAGKV